jgi:hypothetical protein
MPGKSKKGGGLEVGSPYKMKGFSGFGNSPLKQKYTVKKAKSKVEGAKETVKAYKEPGEVRKAGTSIYQEQYLGTGETKHTKKAERKIKKAEKKISKAEKALAKGKTKKAGRKLRKAEKKAYGGVKAVGKGDVGSIRRTVQPKYEERGER